MERIISLSSKSSPDPEFPLESFPFRYSHFHLCLNPLTIYASYKIRPKRNPSQRQANVYYIHPRSKIVLISVFHSLCYNPIQYTKEEKIH